MRFSCVSGREKLDQKKKKKVEASMNWKSGDVLEHGWPQPQHSAVLLCCLCTFALRMNYTCSMETCRCAFLSIKYLAHQRRLRMRLAGFVVLSGHPISVCVSLWQPFLFSVLSVRAHLFCERCHFEFCVYVMGEG